MKRQLLFLLSFLFFSFCNTLAQSKKIKKQIHVLLVAADDNTAIPEATVYAEGNTFKALYRATSEQSGMAVVNVETGGNFIVTVSHPKFISAKQNIKVDLYGDKSIYVLEFRLKRKKEAEKLNNTLNVYVTDANKKPIEGAGIVVMPGVGAVTNSLGFAKATHRQHPGEYIVVIASANGYKDQRKRVLVGTEQGNAITRVDDLIRFALEKGYNDRNIFHLIVEVLDDITNEPVKGANVKLQISDGTDVSGTTNQKGEIKFSDMEYGYEGSGKVMVTHQDYIEKWSDVNQDLMTAKDMDERKFLVYVKKKETTKCPPGSHAALNEQTRKTECYCDAGLFWNSTKTACVKPEVLVAEADCSKYPGSYAGWNAQTQKVECYCPTGKTWNSTMTACVDITTKQVDPRFLGTWKCECKIDLVFNADGSGAWIDNRGGPSGSLQESGRYDGTWSSSGDILYLTTTKGSNPRRFGTVGFTLKNGKIYDPWGNLYVK